MPHSTVVALQCVWDLLLGSEGDKVRCLKENWYTANSLLPLAS